MGVVNLYRGLNSDREIYNINGKLKDNIDLDWDHVEFINPSNINKDYEVKDNDVLIIQEHPSGVTAFVVTAIVLGVVTLGVGIGVGIYAYQQIKKAQREMEEALKRIGKDNRQKDVSTIPQLGDARNEKAEGNNAPLILGRHIFAPYFLSEPYMRPAGEDGIDLYWYGTFLCGQDGLNFEKIRNGNIDLVTLTGNQAQSGKFVFQNPGGDNPPFYDSQNFIEIIQKGYNPTESIFEQKWVDSLDSMIEIGRKPKDNAEIIEDIFIDDMGADPIIRETSRFPMRAEIEIFIDGLHGWDSENGVATDATVNISLEWSVDQISWTPISGWYNRSITRNKVQQLRFLAEINFPSSIYKKAGDPVFIRATRNSRLHTGGYRDRVYLNAIRTQQYNPRTSTIYSLIPAKNINDRIKDRFCRLGIKIKVNKNTQEFLDRFNFIGSMTGRVWNNGWSVEKVKTSNSAAVLLELITGLIHNPSKHKDSEIDLKSFGRLYEYCNNQEVKIADEGIIKINLECNGVLTSGTRKIDVIKQILATCDGGLYVNEFGKLEVYSDIPQITPIALLNPQRIVKMVDQRSLERKADGYAVEFIDQESGWIQVTHRILRPKILINPGLNTYTPIKLDFTTSYYQAMWHARRMMAKEIHRPGELKMQTGKEGRYFKPGSLIKVQHERFKIGIGSGEITELIVDGDYVIGLKLMERFDIASDRDYWIEYYVVDVDRNHVVTKQIQSVGQYTDRLMFTAPIHKNSNDVPVFGNILSAMHGEGFSTKVWEAKRYIVSDLSENEVGYDLSLVEYAEDIYTTTSIDEIPDRVSSIISPAPRVYDSVNDRQLTMENRIPSSRDISNITNNIVNETVPNLVTRAPRYRGVFSVRGTINSEGKGQIGGEIMNLGDWVLYLGADEAGWRDGYCYRWNGVWSEIPMSETAPYMAALADITSGRPNGAFSNLFVNRLFVNALIANMIGAKNIVVNTNGSIQSENYTAGVSGFIIRANGTAEFNDITLRNNINAVGGTFNAINVTSGTFDNITVGAESLLRGRINVGNLICDYDTNSMRTFSYPPGTTTETILSDVTTWLGIPEDPRFTIIPDDGYYGSSKVIQVIFLRTPFGYSMYIYTTAGLVIAAGKIDQPLWLQIGTGDIKMRFVNLPLSAGAGAIGTAYRKPTGNANESYVVIKDS